MKQVIIFLLIVVIAIMGYNTYSKYKRFSFESYEYQVPDGLNLAAADKSVLMDYYRAVESVNGYVITQWSANGIDVRNPKNDKQTTLAAVNEYRDKLATVAYFEAQLKNPHARKKSKEISKEEYKKQLIRKSFYANPKYSELTIGDKNAMVYEIQKLLNAHGDSLILDGLYRTETLNAILAFEQKNGLFPDGQIDVITLEYLLK